MNKSDLRTGMQVECRNGNKYIVMINTLHGNILARDDGWLDLNDYRENLKDKDCDSYDIIKIFNNSNKTKMLKIEKNDEMWEREKFKPHLKSNIANKKYGYIGDKTNLKDSLGQKLNIGDIVTLFENGIIIGDRVIVKNNGESFVMGLRGKKDFDNSTFRVALKQKFDTVKDNNYKVDTITYKLKEY